MTILTKLTLYVILFYDALRSDRESKKETKIAMV